MKKTLLVFVAAVGLGACTFPQNTKMEPVGETQMQTQTQQNPDGTTSEKPASAKSSASAR